MGKIVLVTIPIGDSEDISLKALRLLKEGEIFFAEDTRSFKKLLETYEISTYGKTIDSFHDQSSMGKLLAIIKATTNNDVYIVSEAGSPYLSDPAYPVIAKAIEDGIEVKTTGGINSITYALELSGFPANPFSFHGFISRDSGGRKTYFSEAFQNRGTHIFFEGVSRIGNFLEDLSSIYPDSKVVVARELSKTYESIYRFTAKDYQENLKNITMKGEFVILVHCTRVLLDKSLSDMALQILEDGGKPKSYAKLLAQILGRSVKDIYAELGR